MSIVDEITISVADLSVRDALERIIGSVGVGAVVSVVAPDLLGICVEIYSHVGAGGDLDWHLQDYGYADQLKDAIDKAEDEVDRAEKAAALADMMAKAAAKAREDTNEPA